MAEIVLGIGSSHSPMLSTPYEAFAGLADLDRARLPEFAAKARENAAWIGRELHAEVTRARHEATQAAIRPLSDVLADEAPDVVVVIGDDQGEWFSPDDQPALCIYWGESVENLPPPVERVPPSLPALLLGLLRRRREPGVPRRRGARPAPGRDAHARLRRSTWPTCASSRATAPSAMRGASCTSASWATGSSPSCPSC